VRKKINKKPIPTKVKVGDSWYKIQRDEVIAGCRGQIDYKTHTIHIAARSAAYPYTSDEQFNTFWHELTHAILKDMGSPMEGAESFVSNFSNRLTDAINSAKF